MKTWFITGCSKGGIGYEIAKAALENGDKVALTGRNTDKFKDLSEKFPNSSMSLVLDVCKKDHIKKSVSKVKEKFNRIDILVNNAGYAYRSAIEEGEDEEIRKLYETNLFGPVYLIKEVLPIMRDQNAGTIINFSSISAVESGLGSAFYASSKAGLELLSDGLRKEVGDLGIKVMIVEPGAFNTKFHTTSLKESNIRIKDYKNTAWKTRPENLNEENHPLNGDPVKAGKLIANIVDKKDLPLRLQLGSDSVSFVKNNYQKRLDEVKLYENLSKKTDFSK